MKYYNNIQLFKKKVNYNIFKIYSLVFTIYIIKVLVYKHRNTWENIIK